MSGNGTPEPPGRPRGLEFEELLSDYLDQLNDVGFIDPDEILAEHPDIGPTILRDIEAYVQLRGGKSDDTPLGTLGDYTLRRQIGRGGMGVVYEAWEGSMDRVVALKVLPPGVAADNKAFTRFLREAKTAGQLRHENIVGVYSTGVKEGTPWYSMEYVEGETLTQMLARIKDAEPDFETPFGKKDDTCYFANIAEAFANVADGLQHAHSKGVTHRDIKPSNLILDGAGRLRILDFGLARLEGQESLTLSGDFLGTPLYMSPEQARRKKTLVDHRTDVYSLGATMYEAICGRPPFRGKDYADTLSKIIERDPVEPRKVNSRVPKDLETIVLKCVRKDARDRYGTAEALGQDLRRFARGDAIEARSPSRVERTWRNLQVHRDAIVVGAVLLLFASMSAILYVRAEGSSRAAKATEARLLMLDLAAVLSREQFVLEANLAARTQHLRLPVETLGPIDEQDLHRLVRRRALDDVAEAAERLEQLLPALAKRNDARDLHYLLARAWRFLDDRERAIRAARMALELDPGFAPAAVLLSEIEPTLTHESREDEPDWCKPWRAAYAALKYTENTEERWGLAREALDELIDLVPFTKLYAGAEYELHIWRGVVQLELGETAKAKEDFIIARDRASHQSLEPTFLLAKAYIEGAEEDRARAGELCDALVSTTPPERRDEIRLWIVALFRAAKRPREAKRWAELIEDPALNRRLRAFLELRAGDWQEAARLGREAVEADPSSQRAHHLAVDATIEWLAHEATPSCEDLVELLELLEGMLRVDPTDGYAKFLLRAAAARLGPHLSREKARSMSVSTSCTRKLDSLCATLFAGFTRKQEPLFEDFTEDPDPYDGHPTTWVSVAHVCCRVSVTPSTDGVGICLGAVGAGLASQLLTEAVYSGDVTVQAAVSHWSQRAGLSIHFDGDALDGYFARTGEDGNVCIRVFENARITRVVSAPAPRIAIGEAFIAELRSVGSMVEFRVWVMDDERPEDPTISLEDETHRTGRVGLAGFPEPHEACYSWVSVTPRPLRVRGPFGETR